MSEAIHELRVTRFIAAPPAKVWEVLATRQPEWWCPAPWTITLSAQQRRAGGAACLTMHGPDGEVVPQVGIYLAWEEGRRIVTTDAITPEFAPAGPFMIGVWEIEPEADGTRYTAAARHWSEEARKRHEAMGFADGWTQVADQLAAICEAEAAG